MGKIIEEYKGKRIMVITSPQSMVTQVHLDDKVFIQRRKGGFITDENVSESIVHAKAKIDEVLGESTDISDIMKTV